MWRLALLRWYIAASWIIFGVSANIVVYHNSMLRSRMADLRARDELAREGPQLHEDDPRYQKRFLALRDFHYQQPNPFTNLSWNAWRMLFWGSIINAVGLMCVFPGLQAALKQQKAMKNPDEKT